MNISKALWVSGGIVVACVVDLIWMFWSRSQTGNSFHKAGWHAQGLGKGKYDIPKLAGKFASSKQVGKW